ncbi:MAG: ABC transporter ATP-binding protein [Vicinamibacteraceae bacterium]|nr:ABC transporter ATP-binding protein [Vicinamibacteraceae bacterium]
MPDTNAALAARDLSKHFPGVDAVSHVSLDVAPGEIVGLLGPNGAGKTTTLRMLAGILSPDTGTVHVAGLDIRQHPLEAKRRLGFLSGDTQLYQRLTPREVLDYFGRLYGMPDATRRPRIEALVAQLDMTAFADRPCGTLSSGQRQRANIARAFLHDPHVLVLDEPTTALDIISGRFIVETIRREKAEGRAVLFSTHIMGEAEYLCDRIYLLHRGRVVDQGPLEGLLERSRQTNLTDAFLALIGEPVLAEGV